MLHFCSRLSAQSRPTRVGLVVLVAAVSMARGEVLRARMADDFVNSIGVCAHWGYPDTPYGARYETVRDRLVECGIRNVRDGLHGQRPRELGARGIRSTIVVDLPHQTDSDESYITGFLDKVKTAREGGGLIDAIEGPNEPDLFWSRFGKTYKGRGFPEGVVALQRDLYAAIKTDSALADMVVIGPSLGVTYDPASGNPFADGSLTDCVDWGNFHPYPGGNPFSFPAPYATIEKYPWHGSHPSGNIDEWPYALNMYAPPFSPKPMAATETGYSTNTNGVSERVHATYMPRLFLEYYRKGIRRTLSYEFVDEWDEPDNREACFGLLRNDLSRKPAFFAVKNLIALLADPGPTFVPDSLELGIEVSAPPDHPEYDRTRYVHHVLLQKRNGSFYLALWHEIANTDNSTTPPREIEQPAMPTVVSLPATLTLVKRHTLLPDGTVASDDAPVSNGSVATDVPDRVVILEMSSPVSTAGVSDGNNGLAGVQSRPKNIAAPVPERVRLYDLSGRRVDRARSRSHTAPSGGGPNVGRPHGIRLVVIGETGGLRVAGRRPRAE